MTPRTHNFATCSPRLADMHICCEGLSTSFRNGSILVHRVEIDPQFVSEPLWHSLDGSRGLSGYNNSKSSPCTKSFLRHPPEQLPEHRVHVQADRSCTPLRLCEDSLPVLLSDYVDEVDLTLDRPALSCMKTQNAWMTRSSSPFMG